MECGKCGANRSEGAVCCEAQARNQAELNPFSPCPANTPANLAALYEQHQAWFQDQINDPETMIARQYEEYCRSVCK